MRETAVAVLGVGVMGRRYARALSDGRVSGAFLAALCDPRAGELAAFGVPVFAEAAALFDWGQCEVVVVAAPHPLHAPLAEQALARGLHVLVEKPAVISIAEGERLLAAHRALPARSRPLCGVALTLRSDARYARIRALVQGGELGKVHRFGWSLTDRFRPAAYYSDSPWRGTWAGEGGGLLLNQCSHQLDQLTWWFGAPRRTRAFCRFGRFHEVEVEDDVTAYVEFEGGQSGTFVACSGEAPGTHRLEIAGELGKLVFENDELTVFRSARPMGELRAAPTDRVELGTAREALPLPAGQQGPDAVLSNFVRAVRGEDALAVPLEAGFPSVELANAMVLSSVTESTVELPLAPERYESLLADLRRSSTARSKGI